MNDRTDADGDTGTSSSAQLWASWLFVGLPLAWGMIMTLRSALALFG